MFGFGRRRPETVAFDIIGTVFPLEPLRTGLMALGLPRSALETWFAAGLRDAFAISAAGRFQPLTTVLEGALDQVLGEYRLDASARAKRLLIGQMQALPARPDAREAFETVLDAGMRLIAFSNGAEQATITLLRRARLLHLVDTVVSVEPVRAFKPRPEVYRYAARMAQTRPGRMALVAIHPWDIQGAAAAGWTTAFVAAERPYPRAMHSPDDRATYPRHRRPIPRGVLISSRRRSPPPAPPAPGRPPRSLAINPGRQ